MYVLFYCLLAETSPLLVKQLWHQEIGAGFSHFSERKKESSSFLHFFFFLSRSREMSFYAVDVPVPDPQRN